MHTNSTARTLPAMMPDQSKSKRRATASKFARRMATMSPARNRRLLGLRVNWTIRLKGPLPGRPRGASVAVLTVNRDATLYTVGRMSCQAKPSPGGHCPRPRGGKIAQRFVRLPSFGVREEDDEEGPQEEK